MKDNKITDERLKIQTLKNTRTLFIIQTILIIIAIVFEAFYNGLSPLSKNPLMFIFLITTVISAFQSMTITRDTTEYNKNYSLMKSVTLGVISVWIVFAIIYFAFLPKSQILLLFGVLLLATVFTLVISFILFKKK